MVSISFIKIAANLGMGDSHVERQATVHNDKGIMNDIILFAHGFG